MLGDAAVEALVNVAGLFLHRVVVSCSLRRSLTTWRHVEHPAVTCLGRVGHHAFAVQLLVAAAPGQLLNASSETRNRLVGDVLFGHPRLLGHDLHIVVRQIDVWQRQDLADVVSRKVGDFLVVAVDEATVGAVGVVDLLFVVLDAWLVGRLALLVLSSGASNLAVLSFIDFVGPTSMDELVIERNLEVVEGQQHHSDVVKSLVRYRVFHH